VTIDFTGSRNVNLLPPFKGLKPTLIVEPSEFEIVLLESSDIVYSVSQRYSTSIKKKESI